MLYTLPCLGSWHLLLWLLLSSHQPSSHPHWITSVNIPQPFLPPFNVSSIPSLFLSSFSSSLKILCGSLSGRLGDVVLCRVTRMMPALIIHLSGSPAGVLGCSFMCSLNGSIKMLLFPPNCSLILWGSYRELVFMHARQEKPF